MYRCLVSDYDPNDEVNDECKNSLGPFFECDQLMANSGNNFNIPFSVCRNVFDIYGGQTYPPTQAEADDCKNYLCK